tara:strand:+ start:288 stop:824 length:537 start_codon:yes stop_codon:yes gene_type:complete
MIAQQSTKKKGQIQLNETIMVLFVIVIILFVGLFVYYKYSIASIKETAATLSEEETTILLAALLVLPELRCDEGTCLDTAKFLPFKQLTETKQLKYAQFLGSKTITIEQVYPPMTTETICTQNHYQQFTYPNNCKKWILYENKPVKYTNNPTISTIVSLYFPELQEYRIGRMHIEVYL